MNDPGSLQNLNDIVLPETVALWPPAPGWYVVMAVLFVLLTWGIFRALKSWRKNTYRREAKRELASILARGEDSAAQIPPLLKRAALAAWPRQDVAGLNGPAWHAFLDRTGATDRFCAGAGDVLDRLSYGASGGYTAPQADIETLGAAAEHWLKHHSSEVA